MGNKDKVLRCVNCGSQFYFTERDQTFFKQKGWNIPKLCKPCRDKKKAAANAQPRERERYIPRACTTCYFYDEREREYEHGIVTEYCIEPYCTRKADYLENDAPCSNWTKKMRY